MFRVFLMKTTWHWTLSSWFSRSGMVAFKIERSCPYSSGVPAWRVEGVPWWTSFPHFLLKSEIPTFTSLAIGLRGALPSCAARLSFHVSACADRKCHVRKCVCVNFPIGCKSNCVPKRTSSSRKNEVCCAEMWSPIEFAELQLCGSFVSFKIY